MSSIEPKPDIPETSCPLSSVRKDRRERIMGYVPLIDPKLIGAYLAEYLSDPDIYGALPDDVSFHYKLGEDHGMGFDAQQHAERCAEKYLIVYQAFKLIDDALKAYYSDMLKDVAQLPQNEDAATLVKKVQGLEHTTRTVDGMSGILSAFYVVELDRIDASSQDILAPSVHWQVLNQILGAEPLKPTFLASHENNFIGCPFYAIKKVLSVSLTEHYDGSIGSQALPYENGALLPFVINKIAEAKGMKPTINAALDVGVQPDIMDDLYSFDGI